MAMVPSLSPPPRFPRPRSMSTSHFARACIPLSPPLASSLSVFRLVVVPPVAPVVTRRPPELTGGRCHAAPVVFSKCPDDCVHAPPRPLRLAVLGSGVGGGAYETAPPAMVLSLSSLVSSPFVALVSCRPDARVPSRFLRCPRETAPPAIVVSSLSHRQSPPGYCACLDERSSSLSILVVPVSLRLPPPLPLSRYNRTCPDTLPNNGRVFSWSSRSPSPRRFPLASNLSPS